MKNMNINELLQLKVYKLKSHNIILYDVIRDIVDENYWDNETNEYICISREDLIVIRDYILQQFNNKINGY